MQPIQQLIIEQITVWAPRAGFAFIVFLAFWLLAKTSAHAIRKGTKELKFDKHLSSLFIRISKISLIGLGIITALGTLGVNVSALVTGLGLTGFALGFAFKDTISNLLAGILILIYHPFEIGNQIVIAGYEGQVISIDLRYTKLEAENKTILIPNSKLFTDPITILNK